jgi:hypothetical protein
LGLRHYRSKWQTDEHPGVYRHASTGAGLRDGREPQALKPEGGYPRLPCRKARESPFAQHLQRQTFRKPGTPRRRIELLLQPLVLLAQPVALTLGPRKLSLQARACSISGTDSFSDRGGGAPSPTRLLCQNCEICTRRTSGDRDHGWACAGVDPANQIQFRLLPRSPWPSDHYESLSPSLSGLRWSPRRDDLYSVGLCENCRRKAAAR